jgi:hypothetical protein
MLSKTKNIKKKLIFDSFIIIKKKTYFTLLVLYKKLETSKKGE